MGFAGADADFRRAIELSPNHLPSYNWYALSLSNQGRFEESLAMMRKGLALDPLSAVIRSNIGFTLSALGQFDEARETFERSIEMHPESGFGYTGYAVYHAGVRGRIDDAALWMSKSLEVDPTDMSTMSFLAFLYLTLGDSDTAERWLDRSVVAQPDNEDERDEAEDLANDVHEYVVDTSSFAGQSQSHFLRSPRELRLHRAAEIDSSHTSTDKLTCTTSATRKKSANGTRD